MFLRNHGVVICGESIEEAVHFAFNLVSACETQLRVISLGLENLCIASTEAQERTHEIGNQPAGGVEQHNGQQNGETTVRPRRKTWKRGELEFQALMRYLDNSVC